MPSLPQSLNFASVCVRPYLPGISHPLNTEYLKSVWTKTHINSFDYYICAARGPTVNDYQDFIAVLQATANFSVDGRQFRIWLGAPRNHFIFA